MKTIATFAALSLAFLSSPARADYNGHAPNPLPSSMGGTGASSASGAIANLGALPHVASGSALRALAAGAYASVVRDGYASAGDAPPLLYAWQSTCPKTADNIALYVAPSAGGSGCWSAAQNPATALSNPREWGALADTKVVTIAATINSGTPTTLSVPSNTFASADVGKYIVVPFAGAQISWLGGSITSVPIATNGSGYPAVPTVSFSGGGGSGVLAQPLMQISSVSANVTGTGCRAGTYTAAIAGGKYNTAAGALSVTITAGSVSAVSVTTVGDYFVLPTLTGNVASAAIPGCSVQPTFNLTANLGSVLIQWGGTGYSLTGGAVTASLSGGSPGTAATLGTVVASPFIAPLATTIAGYTSPTQITLAASASSFLSAQSVRIVWGHDDCSAINTEISTLPNGSTITLPSSNYGCNGSLNYPNVAVKLEGDGTQSSTVYELAQSTALFQTGSVYTIGGVVRDLTFDGNRLAQFSCLFNWRYQFVTENLYCLNAATPTASGSANYSADYYVENGAQLHSIAPYARNDGGLYLGSGDLPTYNIWDISTDNTFVDPLGVNATQANFRVETSAGDSWVTNFHGWGSIPSSLSLIYAAQDCLEVAAYSWLTEPGCDIARGDGVLVSGSGVHGYGGHLLGTQVQGTAALAGAYGLEIAGGLNSVVWTGYDAGSYLTTSARVHEDTPYSTGSYIWAGANYGNSRYNLGAGNTVSTSEFYGVCAGSFSTCNGTYSFVAGESNTNFGTASTNFGNNTCDFGIEGSISNGYGDFNSVKCTSQSLDIVVAATTTDGSTAVALLTNQGGAAGNYNQIPVPTISGQSYTSTSCRLTLTGINAASGVSSMWTSDNALFKNVGGTVSKVGTSTWTLQNQDSGASTWGTPVLTADSTNHVIAQTITGVASTTINWVERAHCEVN